MNLYSLFVERAQALVRPSGVVALLTPSGIAADKGAAVFFKSIATTGRLGALFDFENRKVFFADVHASFKFCTLVFGGPARRFENTRCAFFLHALDDLAAPERTLRLSAEDFARVNPNTGAAPIFRNARDSRIAMQVYAQHTVLVQHGAGNAQAQNRWAMQYVRMFDMTTDSGLFRTAKWLQDEGFSRADLGRWRKGDQCAWPLYEGKMLQAYDHRAADVVVNTGNLHRAAQPSPITARAKADAGRMPAPQYWVLEPELAEDVQYVLGYKDVTAPTNMRSMIAAILPRAGFGNTVPLLLPSSTSAPQERARISALLLSLINSSAFDFLARQKIQGQHLNWFILEQLPVIAPARFEEPLPEPFTAAMRKAGLMNGHHANPSFADFVIPQVLALSYTAHDLAAFARDLGFVDAQGEVLPPITWNDADRRARLAALDALFFHLYGLGADDAAYMLDTFPIVRQQDEAAFGHYRTKADVLALLPLLQPADAD